MLALKRSCCGDQYGGLRQETHLHLFWKTGCDVNWVIVHNDPVIWDRAIGTDANTIR